MPTAPPTLTSAPTSPDRSDRATFSARAIALDDFIKNTHIPEVQLAIDATYANAVEAEADAIIAAGAVASAGAAVWVSGSFTAGNVRYSPTDYQTYRARTTGSLTTDPANDPTNWARVNLSGAGLRVARSTNVVITANDYGKVFDLSTVFTQTLASAASIGSGWYCILRNAGGGDVTVDANASELIDGILTYVLKPGFTVMLCCSGTAFFVVVLQARTYDNVVQYTASNTLVVPSGCYVIRPYCFGSGAAGVTTTSGGGGGCAFGDVAVTPGETVTITISAGVAKITTAAVDRLTANPASGVTAGTASKHASVTNGNAYSGGTGAASSGGASSGSPLGTGTAGGTSYGGGGGWGGAGGSSNSGGGGGVGGTGPSQRAGPGLSVPSTDPLLFGLTGGLGAMYGASAAVMPAVPGLGGIATTGEGSPGGFGAGGGPVAGTGLGGAGGFGGGGGGGSGTGGGAGGYGGGGGASSPGAGGAGGAAVVRIYY